MSHDATNWAIEQRGLSPTSKLVLWRLADSYNPEHGCFISQKFIAEKVEISRATVNRCLDELVERQMIARQKRVDKATGKQMSTRYFLACEKGFTPQEVVVRVSNLDTATADEPGEKTRELPVENSAARVSEIGGSVSQGSETQTCKDPNTPLPPADFDELVALWPDGNFDVGRVATAFDALSAADQAKAVALIIPFRQAIYSLNRPLPRFSAYLRDRLFLEFDSAPGIEQGRFKITPDRPEWQAWMKAIVSEHGQRRADGVAAHGVFRPATRWPSERRPHPPLGG